MGAGGSGGAFGGASDAADGGCVRVVHAWPAGNDRNWRAIGLCRAGEYGMDAGLEAEGGVAGTDYWTRSAGGGRRLLIA